LQLSRPEYNSRQIRVNPLSALSLLADDEQLNGRGPVTASDGVTDTVISVHYTSVCLSLRHTSIGSLRLVVQSGTRTWNLIETTNKTPVERFLSQPGQKSGKRQESDIASAASSLKYHRRISHQFGQGHVTSEHKHMEEINKAAPQPIDGGLGQRTLQSNQRLTLRRSIGEGVRRMMGNGFMSGQK
jgi:hypothetical protein